jgi:hypothetical protein
MAVTQKSRDGHARFDRYRHRVTCDLVLEGTRHRGIVTDVSASGLYVCTKERSDPGATVRLVLHEDNEELELDACVVREHRTSRHYTTGIPSGLGVRIVAAPESYFQLLARLSV